MSEDILAMIDGAIADYTSPDAMRWSPEPEKSEAERVVPWWDGMQPAMFYTASSSPVPERPRIDITFDVRPFLGAVEATMKQLRAVFRPFIRSAFERPARRPEKLRRMHTAYRRRARARRRR